MQLIGPVSISGAALLPVGVCEASDAAMYTKQTGVRCPLFDPSRPIQNFWMPKYQSLPALTPESYLYIGSDPTFLTQKTTAGALSQPNIAVFGTFMKYPEWFAAQAPSGVTLHLTAPFVGEETIGVSQLVDPAVAMQVLGEINQDLGGGYSLEEIDSLPAGTIIYGSDPRRMYYLVGPQGKWNLAEIVAQRFGPGVFSPGSWAITASIVADGPQFLAETFPGDAEKNGTAPLPVDPKYMDATAYKLVVVMPGDIALETVASQAAAPPTDFDLMNGINRIITALGNAGIR